jgi:protein-disulfide isomerase/predicted small secreted protein
MTRLSPIALAVLAATLLAGCATAGAAAGKDLAKPRAQAVTSDPVVARFSGGAVTASELEAATYDARKEALEELVLKKVLDARAKAAGITAQALMRREVAARLQAPTDADVKAKYDEEATRQQLPPLEAVRDQVVQYLTGQAQQKAQHEYLEALRAEAKVELLLTPPRFAVAAEGPSRGPEKAPITIVEFSDFECPYCARGEASIAEVMKAYEGKVRLVYRDYPLPFHGHAQKAAEAAHCAGDQGQYWKMHETLFANQQALAPADLTRHAATIGLDLEKFATCLESGAKAPLVEAGRQAGEAVGVNGTPAFFINGVRLSGAQPFAEFKAVIDAELARP